MLTLVKYRYFIHPKFEQGIVIEDIYKYQETVDVFFFKDKTKKEMIYQYVSDNCSAPIEIIKLKDVISDEFIDAIFDSYTQEKGKKYVSDSRIRIIYEDDYKVEAEIIGTLTYKVIIQSKKTQLSFSCTCPVNDDECKHVYALMKYLSNRYNKVIREPNSPFEDMLFELSNASPSNYFGLGFEIRHLFNDQPERSSQTIIRHLKGYDYYSNRAFAPLLTDPNIYHTIFDLCADYSTRLRLDKVKLRYENALNGRNSSYEDCFIALIFNNKYKDIFIKYDFNHFYISPLIKAAILYAAERIDLTVEDVINILNIGLSNQEINQLFEHSNDKAVKKLLYLQAPSAFNHLSKEEIKNLEYTVEEIYELFIHSTIQGMAKIIINNYQRFIDEGKEEYLPGMIFDALAYNENVNRYYLKLFEILKLLSDNSLVLDFEFNKSKSTAKEILERWRGYDHY